MGKRILFVEDNHYHRLMVTDFLESRGYTLLCLPDGDNFFAAIAEFKPSLILLDLKLPKVDGYTLLEQLMASEWQNIPVVVISAYAFEHEQKRALDLGARDYLTKPTKLDDICGAIEAAMESGHGS